LDVDAGDADGHGVEHEVDLPEGGAEGALGEGAVVGDAAGAAADFAEGEGDWGSLGGEELDHGGVG